MRGINTFYYYICAAFLVISAVVSFAFLKAKQKNSTLITVKYALPRSFSILLVAICLLIFADASLLIALSAVMIGVQLFDGIVGLKVSTFKTIGPVTAACNTILLILFLINQ